MFAPSLDADQLTLTATGLAEWSSVSGVILHANSHADLGDNSTVILNGSGDLSEGVAVKGANSSFQANALTLQVSTDGNSMGTGRGIAIEGAGTSVDLGTGSSISMDGFSYGAGVSINGAATGAEFTADNLTVDVTGQFTNAIMMDAGFADLGKNSTISATGESTTLWVTGGEFQAEELTVNTAQSVGIIAQGGDVKIGTGSVVDGRSTAISGSATNGIAATSGSTLDFKGDTDNRNAIYAIDGYGVSAQHSGAVINVANTDIIMSGDNSSYGLWAIGSNDLNRPGIINGENMTIDMTASGENG